MNRLFISTQECFAPDSEILYAEFVLDNMESFQEISFIHPNHKRTTLRCSSQEEASWFMRNIFILKNNPNNIIIDYMKNLIEIVNDLPAGKIEAQKLDVSRLTTAIQSLELEEK